MRYRYNSRKSLRAFRFTFAAAAAGFLLFQFVPPFHAKAAPAPKVEICHIPPGNPANAHTISVGGNAIKSHLKHGDYLGACQLQCEDACDDGNPCTIDECVAGECDHSPVSCNDGNQCTADSCNSETGGCDNVALPGQTCTGQDGSACTLDTGFCNAAADCELTAIPDCCESDADCADEDLCTFEVCTSNACVSDGTAFCAPDDACEQTGCDPDTGQCVDIDVVCDPPGPCETGGYCDPTAGCVYAPIPGCCVDDSGCNDNDPCTADTCIDNSCEHEVCHDPVSVCDEYETCDDNCIPIVTGPADCSDGNLCTVDDCDPEAGGCVNLPGCSDEDVCTDDVCVSPEIGCESTETDCDDGDFCTVGEFCDRMLGACASSRRDCDDDDLCTIDTCSTELADCVNAPKCNEAAGESCNPATGACEVALSCAFSTSDSAIESYHVDELLDVTIPFGGAVDIACEGVEGGEWSCSAAFANVMGPYTLPGLGELCIVPMPADYCDPGVISCEAGTDQNVTFEQRHNIGSCENNDDCKASCESYCSSKGTVRVANSPACEGFCRLSGAPMCLPDYYVGAPNPNLTACDEVPYDTCDESVYVDTEISFGHEGFCGCQCVSAGEGNMAGPGEALLNVGYRYYVLRPGDYTGPDGPCTADDEPSITIPPICIPYTTSTASVNLPDAAYKPKPTDGFTVPIDGAINPPSATGVPFPCVSGAPMVTPGVRLQGVVAHKDTNNWDEATQVTITCE